MEAQAAAQQVVAAAVNQAAANLPAPPTTGMATAGEMAVDGRGGTKGQKSTDFEELDVGQVALSWAEDGVHLIPERPKPSH